MSNASLVVLASSLFLGIVAIFALVRSRVGDKLDVRNSDVLVAFVPVVVLLLLSGKIRMFEAGGVKVEAAIVEASQKAIAKDVAETRLPVDPIAVGAKEGLMHLASLIESRTEALRFRLGSTYSGAVIQEYLRSLTRSPAFKYLLFDRPDGTFFGLADARGTLELLSPPSGAPSFGPIPGWDDLARWVERSDASGLARLPGFVQAADVVRRDAEKSSVLEKMEARGVQQLPVVDDRGAFVGTVDRGHLVTSLVLDVARKVR